MRMIILSLAQSGLVKICQGQIVYFGQLLLLLLFYFILFFSSFSAEIYFIVLSMLVGT